jgi:membrane protein YqaA with SNARE-associated domain
LSTFKSLATKLGRVLALYGGWGLFTMSFLDSSFVPLPVFNDLALMLLAAQHPRRAFLYALLSTAGSVLGTFALYGLARGGGLLWRESTSHAVARSKRWLKQNDFVALLVASLLPPPAPMKVIVLTAGVLRVNALRFGAAMLVGRGLRFGTEAWLGARYGCRAEGYLRQNLGWVSWLAVILIVGIVVLYRWLSGRRPGRSGVSGGDGR